MNNSPPENRNDFLNRLLLDAIDSGNFGEEIGDVTNEELEFLSRQLTPIRVQLTMEDPRDGQDEELFYRENAKKVTTLTNLKQKIEQIQRERARLETENKLGARRARDKEFLADIDRRSEETSRLVDEISARVDAVDIGSIISPNHSKRRD